ncbi:Serine/threonine protein kinase PrkC, regulator of stationary phase [Candidatus Sumerlaea chitinivorans]|jgi:tetratricopeptide (TPR) repeat protein|uniref:Serine/threonine protein kinase PrkC, regulator of stationary phase n=1 Tax=Sumerlaea chitinivorans TaxID=2250252 RepID=A0A2Z4Y762_SUMC1|nr:Serine/threonine protein kinase PrkC, regulator of stationary phase [Candidatus Sumerlaea chitinivorans]
MTSLREQNLTALEVQFASDPTNAHVLIALASEYYRRGIFSARSQSVYERARVAAPHERHFEEGLHLVCFLRQLRNLTIELGQPDQIDPEGIQESIELVREYLRQHPTSPDLFAALGDLYLVRGNVLLAIGAYENAIKFGYHEFGAILRSYEFAARLHTIQPNERIYFGRIYRQMGLTEQAIELYRTAIAEGFHDPETIRGLVDLLEQEAKTATNQNVLNNLYMEICELWLLLGDSDQALESFRRVRFPINQNYALVRKVAAILIDRQDYRLAFDYLSHLPVDEETKELLNRIAVELEKIGDLDTATFLLRFINENDIVIREAEALREKEIEINTELAVAELNESQGRYDQALSAYVKVLKLGYKEDYAILSRIVELLPLIKSDHIEDFYFIGQYYLDRKDWYRSAQFYDLVLERRQGDPLARQKLREIYDAILGANPHLPELRLRSGDLYLETGALDLAIAEYKHAAQFPETNIEATRRLAIAYMKQQQFTEAFEAFQALPVAEVDLENLYQLHLIFNGRGRVAEALNLLQMIHTVDENYRDVAERIALLRQKFEEQSQAMFVDPVMLDLIGEAAVGRYRYIEKIGSGGMGVVHKVYDLKLNKPVAMKILREGLAGSGKAIERFFREARIAATLNHPNIVNIYDYNINQQTHKSYIAMEYVDGPSLRDMFEDYFVSGPPPLEQRVVDALYYISQICDALQITHSKGIIHRDIKPDNILISSQRIAKITDFGIVHIEEATFTPTGALIGTPRYMSPEQVMGTRLDGRADLYSAGIILYEWLVGAPPFVTGDVAYQQVNIPPVPPVEQNPDIPLEVNNIIMKCLEKNPADRFQTALDLKHALELALSHLTGKPTPAPPPRLKLPGETDMDTII